MRVYKVKAGDTLLKIWKSTYINKYSFNEFKEYFLTHNNNKDINLIKIDEILYLPEKPNINKKNKIIIPLIIGLLGIGGFIFVKKKGMI